LILTKIVEISSIIQSHKNTDGFNAEIRNPHSGKSERVWRDPFILEAIL
jgi:hypothetical protein